MRAYQRETLLIAFLTHLKAFEKIGMPLVQSLQLFLNQITRSYFKKAITQVLLDMNQGWSFSSSLKRHPKIFSPFVISLIEVAEVTNQMPQALDQIRSHLLWIQKQKKIGLQRLRYPLILAGLLTGVLIVMIIQVVPQLIQFTREVGGEISPTLKVLMIWGNFFQNHWKWIGGGVLGIGVSLRVIYKANKYLQQKVAVGFYRVPILGDLLLDMDLAILSRILKTTLASHLDLLHALEISKYSLKNPTLKNTLHQIQLNIIRGQPLVQAFSSQKIFPKHFQHFLEIGLTSNQLLDVLDSLNQHHTESYKSRMNKVLEIFPNVLLLIMGGILMGIILIFFTPLYESISKVII